MKRFFIIVFLCLGAGLRAGEQTSTNEVSRPRPVYRYLFLVDTSWSMSRQKAIAIDTVSKLILSGISGRIQTDEAWNIWTFDDQLHTNVFPAQMWDPRRQEEIANLAYRFLRDQRLRKKKVHLDKTWTAIADEAEFSGALTVFLVTDGTEPMKGTPFDEPINAIFTEHAAGMRKAKKPFVVALVAQDGQFATHAVSPGGGPIYIPPVPIPKQVAANATNEPPAVARTADKTTESTTVTPPVQPAPNPAPKKSLSVEEVSAALRQQQKQPANAPISSTAPTNAPTTQPAQNAPTESKDVRAPTNTPPASTTPSEKRPTEFATAETESQRPPAASAPTFNAAPLAVTSSIPAMAQRPPEALSRSNGTGSERAQNVYETNAEAISSASPAPQLATAAPSRPAASGVEYLLGALALLAVALTLVWLYIRSLRYVPRPSIISQSLDKEQK